MTVRCGSRPKRWKTIAVLPRRNASSSRIERPSTSTPSMRISPSVGSISRLRWRISVDLPEPDRPITTKVSPRSTEIETSSRASTFLVFARSSSLLIPARTSCERLLRRGAEDLGEMPCLDQGHRGQLLTLTVGLEAPAEGLAGAVEDDGEEHDGEPADQPGAGIVPLKADQHRLADAAGADHRGDHHHRQRHHHGLVDALHDRGQRQRNLDALQHLPAGGAEGAARLDHLAIDLPDAEVGEADERRRGVDDGGEDRRHLAEAEEHRRGDQVDEARDGLHQVEDRIDHRAGDAAPRGEHAERDAEDDGDRRPRR